MSSYSFEIRSDVVRINPKRFDALRSNPCIAASITTAVAAEVVN